MKPVMNQRLGRVLSYASYRVSVPLGHGKCAGQTKALPRVFLAVMLVALPLLWIPQGQAVVINIDSAVSGDPLRYSGSPVTSPFQAGSYSCTIVSPSDTPGALFSDWTAWGDARRLTSYEITTPDRILVATGGGMGTYALTNNRTVIFTLTNDTTLLFGVADTWLADNNGGVSLLITPYVFFDGFDDNAVDTNKWTASGYTVQEINGYMRVGTDVTDNGGVLTSLPFAISPNGDITITRTVMLHYANDAFAAHMFLRFGTLPWVAAYYANYDETWGGEFIARHGTYLVRNADSSWNPLISPSNETNVSSAFPVLWDTWFSEKLVYSPSTGVLQYFANNQKVTDYFMGVMPVTNSPTMQLGFRAWGWWTGHQQLFDDFLVTQNITSPVILNNPADQTAVAGSSPGFTVRAAGASPLYYQWRFNGQNIAGATSATLTRLSVSAADSGGYSVVVSNPYGSVTSATASLAVLTDGANGNTPVQITVPLIPAKPPGVKNLVFVTHGWQAVELNPAGPPSQPWMVEMTNDIVQQLVASGQSSDWQIEAYYWLWDAWTVSPDTALNTARNIGTQLGKQFATQGYQRVHLIAHSAGAGLIQAIVDQLKSAPNPPIVQETFLDPFTGRFRQGRSEYGRGADWADDYFVIDLTDVASVLLLDAPGSTSGQLDWAYNVDVGGTLDAILPVQYIVGNGIAGSTPSVNTTPSHGSPIAFYVDSINGVEPSCATGYGFPLSIEDGGSGTWASHSVSNPPVPLCGTASFSQNQQPVSSGAPFVFSMTPYGTSSSGVNFLGSGGASLTSDAPAWLAVGVTVTNAVNVVQFDAGFTDTNAAQGLLTVYWNTNRVGMVDERVASPGSQTYRFALPSTVATGLYTLTLRLDSFENSSSIAVTNVATGFVGVTQPITLGISCTNGAPLVQLTAATNFTYLIQSSTNLVDWTPTALLLNINGTAQFTDFPVTNASARFYRAMMP